MDYWKYKYSVLKLAILSHLSEEETVVQLVKECGMQKSPVGEIKNEVDMKRTRMKLIKTKSK